MFLRRRPRRFEAIVTGTIVIAIIAAIVGLKLSKDASDSRAEIIQEEQGGEEVSTTSGDSVDISTESNVASGQKGAPHWPSKKEIDNMNADMTEPEHSLSTAIGTMVFQGNNASSYIPHGLDEAPVDVLLELANVDYSSANMGLSFNLAGTESDSMSNNEELYRLCSKYFYGAIRGQELSPVFPMAIANNETPGRCNTSITYSSLFPSAVVKIEDVSDIENFDCTTVLAHPKVFNLLTTEYQTRDRGPCQMSTTFGTWIPEINALMGEPESEKLQPYAHTSYPGYGGKETKNGAFISVNRWIGNASTSRGDRFKIQDILYRLTAACQKASEDIERSGYEVLTEEHAVAMYAMFHSASGVWSWTVKNRPIGHWKSGSLAYEYSKMVSSESMLEVIREYAADQLAIARTRGSRLPITIDTQSATLLYAKAQGMGILHPYTNYINQGSYYWVTQLYPIRMLYNYEVLKLLYAGA